MKINVTGVDPIKFIKEVYNLSVPQGLGFIHFKEGGLTNKEAKEILDFFKSNPTFLLSMDYIKGRACKIIVFKQGEELFIHSPWFDHKDKQLEELLKAVWPKGKPFPILKEEHGVSCNCPDCQIKRG